MSSEKSEVIAVCLSERKGIQKHEVSEIELQIGLGIVSDAHAGNWHRQVSLLADESVEKMRALGWKLTPGAFAENILTRGIELKTMSVGTLIEIGNTISLYITLNGLSTTSLSRNDMCHFIPI